MSVSERNPCIATKKEMEPREPVVTYNGEDRSEAAGHGVASERSETRRRELRARVARFFKAFVLWSIRQFKPRILSPQVPWVPFKFLTLTGVPRLRRSTPA